MGKVHVFWRAHNREFILADFATKKLYFDSLVSGLVHRSVNNNVWLEAFCIMSNHGHEKCGYMNGSTFLSFFMRIAHSKFGAAFNKRMGRTGAVTNERPRTPLIGDDVSDMRVHFYIEANPIRARITNISKLKFYFWNSYRFYAHGQVDEYTSRLRPPQWYYNLGKTPSERQRAYRERFRLYVEEEKIEPESYYKNYIGPAEWVETQELELKKVQKTMRIVPALLGLNELSLAPPPPS